MKMKLRQIIRIVINIMHFITNFIMSLPQIVVILILD